MFHNLTKQVKLRCFVYLISKLLDIGRADTRTARQGLSRVHCAHVRIARNSCQTPAKQPCGSTTTHSFPAEAVERCTACFLIHYSTAFDRNVFIMKDLNKFLWHRAFHQSSSECVFPVRQTREHARQRYVPLAGCEPFIVVLRQPRNVT